MGDAGARDGIEGEPPVGFFEGPGAREFGEVAEGGEKGGRRIPRRGGSSVVSQADEGEVARGAGSQGVVVEKVCEGGNRG